MKQTTIGSYPSFYDCIVVTFLSCSRASMFCFFFSFLCLFYIRCQRSDLHTEINQLFVDKRRKLAPLCCQASHCRPTPNLLLEVSSLKIVYSIIYFHFKFYGCHGDEVFCISLYIVSRCHGMDDIVKSLYIFFFLSEIEYSATIDRGGMIHG